MEVLNNMAELGHDVHVVGFLRSRPKRLHPSITFHNITLCNRGLREAMDPDFWRALIRHGRSDKSDEKKDSFYKGWLSYLIESGSFDLVYERRNDFNPGIVLAKRYGIPSILEINGIQSIEFGWKGYKSHETQHILDQELLAIESATKVVCVAEGIKSHFVEKGFDPAKFRVIPNGVNADLFYPMDKNRCRERLGLPLNDNIIGFAGSTQIFYEIECAILAMPHILRILPDTRLIVVGREYPPPLGYSRESLRLLTDRLGVSSKIDLLAPVPYEGVPNYINAFDICLLPIAKMKGWRGGLSPLKLREYLACGRPVVGSNLPGESQLVREVGAGLLYDAGDPEDLADKVCMILKDRQAARQMGENGCRYVLKHGTWRQATEKILTVAGEAITEVIQPQISRKVLLG